MHCLKGRSEIMEFDKDLSKDFAFVITQKFFINF